MTRRGNFIDMTGKKFGRLTVQYVSERTGKLGQVYWHCVCDCGGEKDVLGASLRNGSTKSCGCLTREATSKRCKTHGGSKERLYRTWSHMKARCSTCTDAAYCLYGGRGITVCKEWANSFGAFRDWALANGYSDDLTLDRIDVNGNYCPENCRWTTMKQQADNKQNTVRITYRGETHTRTEWSKITGISPDVIRHRLLLGFTEEEALTFRRRERRNARR